MLTRPVSATHGAMSDMPTGLIRRGGAYSLRRRIPKDLSSVYQDRKEIVRALGTNERDEAKRRHAIAWVELDREFAEARLRQAADPNAHIHLKLRQIADARARSPKATQTTTGEEMEYTLSKMSLDSEEELGEELEYNRLELPRRQIMAVTEVANVDGLSDQEKAMRYLINDLTWERDRAEEKAQAAQRKLASTPAPTPVTTSAVSSRAQSSDASLTSLIGRWQVEQSPAPKTVRAHAAVIRRFSAQSGIHAASGVEQGHVLAFKQALLLEGVSTANLRTIISRLRTILNFGVTEGTLAVNPAKGISAPRSKGPRPVVPWPVHEINKLFAGPVHQLGERPTGCRDDAAYWLPLLALFTGARREELGQLKGRDVTLRTYRDAIGADASAWFISVDYGEDGENQLKTASSQRPIPVHPVLVELGFVDFAKAAPPEALLFSKLVPNRDGKLTEKWGEWFTGYRRECGVTNARIKFHSFRHSFKDLCREAGMSEGLQRQLMGHSASDVADLYGSGFSTHMLVAAINSYRVPGLVLPPPPTTAS